jgi:hypothetical protein
MNIRHHHQSYDEDVIENNEKVELKNEVVFVKPFSPTETRMKMLTNMNDL